MDLIISYMNPDNNNIVYGHPSQVLTVLFLLCSHNIIIHSLPLMRVVLVFAYICKKYTDIFIVLKSIYYESNNELCVV